MDWKIVIIIARSARRRKVAVSPRKHGFQRAVISFSTEQCDVTRVAPATLVLPRVITAVLLAHTAARGRF